MQELEKPVYGVFIYREFQSDPLSIGLRVRLEHVRALDSNDSKENRCHPYVLVPVRTATFTVLYCTVILSTQ